MSRYARVGIFIVGTLLILAAGIFVIGSNDLRFRSKYQIKAQFANVSGLEAGAEVRVGGIHKGTVRSIDLPNRPDGEMTVNLELDTATRKIVNKGSAASVESEGLLGDKYVEVSFGTADGAPLRDGDTIRSIPPIDISDLVKKANDILGTTSEALENVKSTTQNLDEVTNKINGGQGTVGALINDPGLYQRVNSGVTAFQEDMEALKHNFLVRGFFRNRGYEDASDLGRHRIARLPAGKPMASYMFDDDKIFAKADSAKLRDAKALDKAGEYLQKNPYSVAVIVASEGDKGDTEKSRKLSEARAMVVRDYLVGKFSIDDTRLKTLPLGKSDTLGSAPRIEVAAWPASSSTQTTAARH